jgi:HEAT repeat protein
LTELARHEHVSVRKEAVNALGHCHGEQAVAALKSATSDANHDVAEAAQYMLAARQVHAQTRTNQDLIAGERA